MKLILISDTHSMHDAIKEMPEADVLIHAGDFTGRGHPDRVIEFNDWLGKLNYKHKIVIPGNHEITFQQTPDAVHGLITNATLLIDKAITIDGVKFYGSPWQPAFGKGWSYNIPRGQLKRVWDQIPNDTDVLITHGPPHKILDLIPSNNFYGGSDQRVGCEELRDRIMEVRPKLHVFGHIHEAHGQLFHDGTTYVNASICDGSYRPINKPIIVEINK